MVWFAETKASLLPKESYEEALGQLSDRSQLGFGAQPHRQHVMAIALGHTSLEIVCLTRYPDQVRLRRTGQLSLSQSSNKPSPAARMLLRLFFTPADKLDFREPVVPAPFVITCPDGQSCLLSNFGCLRLSDDHGSQTRAYEAQKPDGQHVVVKFGNELAIRHEVIMGVARDNQLCRKLCHIFATLP